MWYFYDNFEYSNKLGNRASYQPSQPFLDILIAGIFLADKVCTEFDDDVGFEVSRSITLYLHHFLMSAITREAITVWRMLLSIKDKVLA